MSRALVIKYGDAQIANAIESGMMANSVYLEDCRKRIERDRRFERACRLWARKYKAKPVHPVIEAILGVWALLWLTVAQFSAMNRS